MLPAPMSEENPPPPAAPDSMRTTLFIIYGLYLVGIFIHFLPIIGVIVAYIKRDDAQNPVYASHLIWIIRSFWGLVVACSIAFILFALVIGSAFQGSLLFLGGLPVSWLILSAIPLWWIYRCIKGMVRLMDNKSILYPTHVF